MIGKPVAVSTAFAAVGSVVNRLEAVDVTLLNAEETEVGAVAIKFDAVDVTLLTPATALSIPVDTPAAVDARPLAKLVACLIGWTI